MSATEQPILPYGRQSIDETDIAAVIAILRSDFITQGPAISRFEQKVAEFCGAKYAVAVANATAALHVGALALGLGRGDWLWTSPNTFVASANCALYCGAAVDFVDIDPATYNLSVPALKAKFAQAASAGRLPKVLVPVHFAGQSCEMEEIAAVCGQYGVRIMEDASHAIGGEYQGARIGGSLHSALTIFSFHPVKILTTGEGGMLLTNDEEVHRKLLRLRTHGITRQAQYLSPDLTDPWCYAQVDLGFNYRLTDLQAALGASQMERLPAFLARRRQLAAQYCRKLSDLPLILPHQHPDTLSSWHLYVVRPDPVRTAVTRAQVYGTLHEAKIHTQVHYIPVHLQPWYRRLGFKPGDFPAAEAYYRGALSLPLYFDLSDADQDRVVGALRAALKA